MSAPPDGERVRSGIADRDIPNGSDRVGASGGSAPGDAGDPSQTGSGSAAPGAEGSELRPLEPHVVVFPLPERFSALDLAQAEARQRSRERIGVWEERCPGVWHSELDAGLDAEDVAGTVQRLLASGSPAVGVLRDGDPRPAPVPTWSAFNGPWQSVTVPTDVSVDPTVVGLRWSDAGGWFGPFADLLDDLSTALGAAVVAHLHLLRGLATLGGRSDGWVILLPLDRPVEVQPVLSHPDGTGPVSVQPGRAVAARGFSAVGPSAEGACLAEIHVRAMTDADLHRGVLEVAKYWPRLRAEMPYDVDQPAEMYGFDEPADYPEVVEQELARLLTADTVTLAVARWGASLRPQRRAVRPLSSTEPPVAVRGRFVGPVGHVGDSNGGVMLAAGSLRLHLPDSLLDSFSALLGNEWIDPGGLADALRDPLLGVLAGLGLVELAADGRSSDHRR